VYLSQDTVHKELERSKRTTIREEAKSSQVKSTGLVSQAHAGSLGITGFYYAFYEIVPQGVTFSGNRIIPSPEKDARAAIITRACPPRAARLRSTSRDSSRATRLPAFLRRLHPATTRHQTREPRDHAPSARRISTRRRLAGSVRQTGGERHSVCGANHASARGAISARVPPSSPSRRARSTHNSTATHSSPHAQHPSAHITMHTPRH
jgi:hypothetical protein